MKLVELIFLAAAALAGVNAAQEEWSRVEPGLELRYPGDHGAHPSFKTEWWYVTGRLRSPDGRRFGYQLTVFRSGLDPTPRAPGTSPLRARHVLAGHLALTDEASGKTLLAERLRRLGSPLATADEHDIDLVLEDWSLVRRGDATDAITLHAGDKGIGVELALVLEAQKPLVLHGQAGYSQKGAASENASAYVSWTRLATSGHLVLNGQAFAVEGSSWFDHEFGSNSLGEDIVGWDWFSLQLDDGRDVMLFQLRDQAGNVAGTGGTLVDANGIATTLAREDFQISALESWTSPNTQATYPAAWKIRVPGQRLNIEVRPWVPDSELVTTGSTDVIYWEGPIAITGSATGGGYAELTGYAGSMTGRL